MHLALRPLMLSAVAPVAALLLATPALAAPPESDWPSLERQLVEAGVAAGTPLGRLIAAHQEISLLRPEERSDDLPIPSWLRIAWRKAHPEGRYSAADPTGGYPLVLKEVHQWMLSHPDLRPGRPGPTTPPAKADVVLGDRRISGPANGPRSESDIRIDFWHPQRVLAASNNIEGSSRMGVYWSHDGGASWGQTELPFTSHDALHSDPVVDWSSDGTAWASTIGITEDGEDLRMRLYRSTDGGVSWAWESTFSGGQTSADKQMMWVDHATGSPFADTIYAIWHADEPVYVNRRRSGGWGSPLRISGGETTGTGIGGDIKTNGAGKVFAFWPDTGSRRIYLATSTDGGDSYSRPRSIASTYDSFDIGIPAQNRRKILIYVSSAAYTGGGNDLVFAAWTDLSGENGCRNAGNAPGGSSGSGCKTRVWFSRSTDGGASWSAKTKVNNAPGKNDQFAQALAVDEQTGALALAYYDTLGDSGRKRTHVWFQLSTDFGESWSAPQRVTGATSNETTSGADDGNQYGDYNSLTGWAGTFLPSWTDRRSGHEEEIWTAGLTAEVGPCAPPPTPTGLAAVAGDNRVDLSWSAAAGAAEYRLYRGTASGGPHALAARVAAPATSHGDTGLDGGVPYFYVVRSFAGCESPASAEVSATPAGGAGCTAARLYFDDFEAAAGLAGWVRGSFRSGGSTTDWRGVQSCGAASGSRIFRFGGRGCRSDYDHDRFSFAQPGGSAGIAVPEGAKNVRLTFAHRFRFERGTDGALLALAIDGGGYDAIDAAHLTGAVYNGAVGDSCPPANAAGLPIFTGNQEAFVTTTVDLDAACNAVFSGSAGCGGHTLRIAFTGVTDCFDDEDGWFLDDVEVTACLP